MTDAVELTTRQVYMVLSPRSLPYARLTLQSLLSNADERLNVHLITDSGTDRQLLTAAMDELAISSRHRYTVTAEDELADLEATVLANHPHIRAFRHGHPCWRKVTDPFLMSQPGEELVLLDPDVLFPNRFRFEATPGSGLLLMWQRPNCLLPSTVVRRAIAAEIPLARHVDIGVCQWRSGTDLDWLDWLLGVLGGEDLPRAMHVEAIVWAAIAMREGGDYLDPNLWVCWHRTQRNRLLQKAGASGRYILNREAWTKLKCFHAGGAAKWWLADLPQVDTVLKPRGAFPFVALSPARYRREQFGKQTLRNLGYYQIFGAS